MKKSLLFAALAAPFFSFGQFTEGFEDYMAGDYVCVVSDHFYPWTAGTEGTDGDLQITDENAFESLNALKVEQTAAAGGPGDVLLEVGQTEGNWSLTWQMLVEEGFAAYFNVQGTDVPGAGTDSWQINCAIDPDGNAAVDGPWGVAAPVPVSIGAWFEVRVVVDLDQGLAKIWLEGQEVAQFPYVGNFSSINFFAFGDGTTTGFYYVDDIALEVSDVVLVDVAEQAAARFGFAPNPTSGAVRLSGLTEAQVLVVLDQMGREVAKTAVDAGQQAVEFDLPNGVYFLGTEKRTSLQKLVIRH